MSARYGAKVQVQERTGQSSFYSSNDPRLHFGLGSATTVDLEVRWPNGVKEKYPNVKADRFITVIEGKGIS